jgi:hypothetical protein
MPNIISKTMNDISNRASSVNQYGTGNIELQYNESNTFNDELK